MAAVLRLRLRCKLWQVSIFNNYNSVQRLTLCIDFRPPTMYYTTIPLVSERQHNRRWDASKLRELRKRMDSGSMTSDEVDQVANDFLDGEIVDLASDWLGNTVSLSTILLRWRANVMAAGRAEVV